MKKHHMSSKTAKTVREIDNFHQESHRNREQFPQIVIEAMKTNTHHQIFMKAMNTSADHQAFVKTNADT